MNPAASTVSRHAPQFGYDFISDFFTHNVPVWQEHLRRYQGMRGLNFLEIGSLEGRSAMWLLENILTDDSSVLHCVDPWEDESIEATFDRNAEVAHTRHRASVVKHKGRSIEELPLLPPETMDLIYIDGSHLSKDVLADVILAWRLLRVGGLLICDDYQLWMDVPCGGGAEGHTRVDGPHAAIDAFLTCFECDYRLLHKEWQVIAEKTR